MRHEQTVVSQTDIVRIGNSQGVRIPKPILEQCGLQGRVEMLVRNGTLVIRPARALREGWAEAFSQAAEDELQLLPEDAAAEWDAAEWQW